MRPRRVHVCTSDPGGAAVQAKFNNLHEVLHISDRVLLKPNNDNILLGVLTRMEKLPIIQEIKQLSAVDLVESDEYSEMGVFLAADQPENVLGGQKKNAGRPLLEWKPFHQPFWRSHHRERFSTASLPVRKAGALCTLEDSIDDGLHTGSVELLVADCLVEGFIKQEVVLLNILCEVNLQFGLSHDDRAVPAEQHVRRLRLHLAAVHGPLADHNTEPAPSRRTGLRRCWGTGGRQSGSPSRLSPGPAASASSKRETHSTSIAPCTVCLPWAW
mmetsp:Transcript_64337/g.104070  ORF Transcript_64337/g.104070 Transcript_64337/m.104070 type:complete len:272 (-) Transcript_64337:223-1038(-)